MPTPSIHRSAPRSASRLLDAVIVAAVAVVVVCATLATTWPALTP